MVGVPHLQVEPCRDLVLGLVPGEHGLLFGDDDLLFGHEVVEGVDEAPVEVALTGDGVIVDVRVLLVLLLPLQPAVRGQSVSAVVFSSPQSNPDLFHFFLISRNRALFTLAQKCHLISRR